MRTLEQLVAELERPGEFDLGYLAVRDTYNGLAGSSIDGPL